MEKLSTRIHDPLSMAAHPSLGQECTCELRSKNDRSLRRQNDDIDMVRYLRADKNIRLRICILLLCWLIFSAIGLFSSIYFYFSVLTDQGDYMILPYGPAARSRRLDLNLCRSCSVQRSQKEEDRILIASISLDRQRSLMWKDSAE